MKPNVRKATFQHVESELFSYHETRREIVRLKNEILYATSTPDNNGGGRGSLPSDPTARTATLMVSHRRIEQMERMVDAIDNVYGRLPEEKKRVILLKYWTRPQTLTWEGIAHEIPAHRATVLRWRDEIIFAVAEKIGWR